MPFYRGGSPLQNQIIRGETISAVSIFRIDGGIDTGDILAQEELSLTDTLEDIFQRIVEVGIRMTESILAGDFTIQRQVGHEGSSFRRLTPAMSEISINELDGKSALHLFNKIRMLQTPYPLPFFTTTGGRKIYIKLVPESEL